MLKLIYQEGVPKEVMDILDAAIANVNEGKQKSIIVPVCVIVKEVRGAV